MRDEDDNESRGQEGIPEFVAEAEEILGTLNQHLLALESAPDKSSVRPDTINAIFRGAHTLKGMSGMVGLKKISELSHRLEDMLDKLRMGKLGMNESVIETMFSGVDALRKMVEQVSQGNGEDAMDVGAQLKRIQGLLSGEPAPFAESPLERLGFDPERLKVLTEYEVHRLLENVNSKKRLFEVVARFKLDTFDRDLGSLNEKIKDFGELITTLPNSGVSPDQGIEFNILIGTSGDEAALQELLQGEHVTIREVHYQAAAEKPGEAPAVPAEPLLSQPKEEDASSIKSLSQTVRVDISKLDALLNVVGELVLNKAVINQISREFMREFGLTGTAANLQKAAETLDRRVSELQEGLIEVRMIPVGQVFERLVRVVRKLARELDKNVDLKISGEETQLDKSMVEEIADPLMHLIRNAIDHGIESQEERVRNGKSPVATITLRAIQQGNNVVIEVEDDGAGIDLARVYQKALKKKLLDENKEYEPRELLNILFLPGFSTSETVTEISGRGVGLDVVAKNIAKLSGMVDVNTELGKGTRFSITLPITLIIIKALIVNVGQETYAIPLNSVSESLMLDPKQIRTVEQREVVQIRDRTLPLLRLRDIFDLPTGASGDGNLYVIVVGIAEKRLGLVVDGIEGQQEIVIKSIGEVLRNIPGIAGATELGNRKTILVLDVGALITEATQTRVEVRRG